MNTHHADLRRGTSLRTPLLAAVAIGLAFFGGFGGWAATAPLAGAALAPAVVVPEGSRKQVQHLEGGIVRRILVQDGNRVAAGQPLVELDDTSARAAHAGLLARWAALAGAQARLEAEQAGRFTVTFPQDLLDAAGQDPVLAAILAGEQERLASRRSALAERRTVLERQIAETQATQAGHAAAIASGERQQALIEEEGKGIQELFRRGLERKPRVLALQRAEAQIAGAVAAARAELVRADQTITRLRQEIRSLETDHQDEIAAELVRTRAALAPVAQELASTEDRLARTVLRAPVAGTVVDLRLKTVGGVVAAGQPLLDIVPDSAELLLEARVAPVDIDEVHAGLQAEVHLLAFRSRNLTRIRGTVRAVSPDRLQDPVTHQPYYLTRVAVDPASLPEGVAMAPGMPAEVMIVTGERTLLSYLVQPITETLRRGMRES
ncbi:MAG TPA: HlyD family type I secretion periplasmic adaptor subunit [Geminicoccus sp.]|uniref:HlyD family type I secretion periplasmic adaptor subunit n=1 Tax=Geminicoccus sp. TaxID=2024832 RepID=UPI002BC65456|nr:HlyD family type I secretion periplasmic adaptor subunit [Geminicoccus sp.]HWL70041.1 HlyD family type I secretion periplasmic adaptor subunit [Geminicoccus sp.]